METYNDDENIERRMKGENWRSNLIRFDKYRQLNVSKDSRKFTREIN